MGLDDEHHFQLFLKELESIDNGIRSYDSALLQIKGWAITVAVAASGAALAQNQATLILLGAAATLAFYFIDAHHKSAQRIFIEGRKHVESTFRAKDEDLSAALRALKPPFIQSNFGKPVEVRKQKVSWGREVAVHLHGTRKELARPLTFFPYALLVVCQLALFTAVSR